MLALLIAMSLGFQSTRPMRGGTLIKHFYHGFHIISIHPPHAGRDPEMRVCKRCGMISIHPPHAGRDRTDELDLASMGISIHPPRAGRDQLQTPVLRYKPISIHPPRAGRDAGCC